MNNLKKSNSRNPWSWIPTLYFAEGLPFVAVTVLSVIMYKRLGISNAEIALYTSWLYLPWVIKPLWSPVVDVLRTKRAWIIITQLLIGGGMAGVAFTIPLPNFFQFTLAFFWLLAFLSATHDISADGFYMIALTEDQQSFFIGIRSTFYRIAMIAGQGLLVILAGYLESALTVKPMDFEIITSSKNSFHQQLNLDLTRPAPIEGALHLIAEPSKLELSRGSINIKESDSLLSTARKINLDNGYSSNPAVQNSSIKNIERPGNIGIIKLYLSKKPDKDDDLLIKLDYLEGDEGINIIEGKTLKFTSQNWNKPAFVVFQIDSTSQAAANTKFRAQSDRVPLAWVFTFVVVALMFVFFFIYHKFILPKPDGDKQAVSSEQGAIYKEFFRSFSRFFEKKNILLVIAFLLVYRLGEAQLVKLAAPFMLDSIEAGGLGLSTQQVGFIYGTLGIIALILGGITGGIAVAKKGLKYWLLPMVFAINIPDALYVYLSFTQPSNIWIVYGSVIIEQFGYGFGFTAFLIYMIYISDGEYKTSHYAIATGFMALGMMVPGMFSGFIQEAIGYKFFFIWVLIATIPAFALAKFIPLEKDFGKKKT